MEPTLAYMTTKEGKKMKGKFSMVVVFGTVFSFIFSVSQILAAEPVKIGCHAEFTGKSSPYGMATLNAVRFEVKKKNEAGGIKSLASGE